jgi:hypothetical protein
MPPPMQRCKKKQGSRANRREVPRFFSYEIA